MNYSLTEVLGCTGATTFADRYASILKNGNQGNVLLAELILCMDDLEHAKPSWFDSFDTPVIVDFLTISHRHYLESVLPSIERQLEALVQQPDCPVLVSEFGLYFFREFRRGLVEHFDYEEEQLFPHVLKIEATTEFDPTNFKTHHPHAAVDLNGLLMLMSSKGGPEEKSMSFRILMEMLHSLEKELKLHEFIEENVLLARISSLG